MFHHSQAVSEIVLGAHVALCIVGLPANDLKVTDRLSIAMTDCWEPVELSSVSSTKLFAPSVVVDAKQL